MPTKKIEKLELLKSNDYYGIVIWESIFGQRMAKRENQSLLINRILGLKTHNKHKDFFKLLILAAQKHFKCSAIAIIPGSKPGLTNLQKALNNGIFLRRKKIASRKYQKEKNYNILKGIETTADKMTGRVLLVDDVITTGYTMDQYAKLLKPQCEVVKFGLGISHKLKPEITDELEIKTKADAEYISRAELAEYLGVTRQRVHTLIRTGRIKEYPGKGIKMADAIQNTGADRSGEAKTYDRYKDAQADREEALAEMAVIELKQRRSELVEIEVVDEAAAATIRITTIKLLAIGTKVAPLVVGEKNIGKIKKVIDDQIYETLNELKKLKDIAKNGNGKH